MQSLSTSAILSVFWADFCGKFQVFWYIHFRKISRNMSIFHYGRLHFQSSYHFTIRNELKLFKVNKILWKSLVNICWPNGFIQKILIAIQEFHTMITYIFWFLFSHLTYRICSLRSLSHSTFSGAKFYIWKYHKI